MNAAFFLFILALAQMGLAGLIWHLSMPRLLDARGRGRAMCAWLLGMLLVSNASITISTPATAGFDAVIRDALIVAYAFCRYRWTNRISAATWRTFSLKGGPHDSVS